jgi:hypothetical protein
MGTVGNKNALRHGLYAKRARPATAKAKERKPRDPSYALILLEDAIDAIYKRFTKTRDDDTFARLANSLSLATSSLFSGHRTNAFISGKFTPVDEAIRELVTLDFDED